MMKSFIAVVFTAVFYLALYPATAVAATFSTTNLNMRAGPGVGFGRIGVIPAGRKVFVRACTRSRRWCRVSYQRHGGWVAAAYLTSRNVRRVASRRGLRVYVSPRRRLSVQSRRLNFRRFYPRRSSGFYVYFSR